MTHLLLKADARRIPLADESVQCVVTSPPYWGLRKYDVAESVWGGDPGCEHEWGSRLVRHKGGPHGDGMMRGGSRAVVEAQAACKDVPGGAFCVRCGAWRGQLGLEPTPDLYVEHMVEVFREVRRVLRSDGTVWLNMGDCYATGAGKVGGCPDGGEQGARWAGHRGARTAANSGKAAYRLGLGPMTQPNRMPLPGLKPKDLVGMPWRLAFALQADGWWVRSEITWCKKAPMPESVTDRPTTATEKVFLLTKGQCYFYDAEAVRQPSTERPSGNKTRFIAAEGERDRLNTHLGSSVPYQPGGGPGHPHRPLSRRGGGVPRTHRGGPEAPAAGGGLRVGREALQGQEALELGGQLVLGLLADERGGGGQAALLAPAVALVPGDRRPGLPLRAPGGGGLMGFENRVTPMKWGKFLGLLMGSGLVADKDPSTAGFRVLLPVAYVQPEEIEADPAGAARRALASARRRTGLSLE